ncbi:MAG TPA: hypothetical protein VMT81_03330 [Candidatus Paceibacterota bacterium]|nr:hypothetical protein [Candidatus Paceibacterota bacterium]
MKEEAKRQISREKSMRRVKIATYIILAIAAVLAIYVYVQSIPPPPGMYDAFAKCIAQTGTRFYGAFWCPHCAAQKTEFGTSEQYLPYTECSTNGGPGTPQAQACIDANVQEYPTWVFPDGSRLTGTVELATLAQKTGCALPGGSSSTTEAGSSSPAQSQ